MNRIRLIIQKLVLPIARMLGRVRKLENIERRGKVRNNIIYPPISLRYYHPLISGHKPL